MNTIQLKELGLSELSTHELNELNGGGWGAIIRIVVGAIAGAIGGAAVSQCSDDCTTTTTSCVDENGCTITTSTTVCN